MKALIIAIGSSGDVHPFMGIANAMRTRGHRVQFLASRHFEPLANRLGIDFVPLGTVEDYERVLRIHDLWHPRKGLAVVLKQLIQLPRLRLAYERLATLVKPRQTVIVASTLAFAARLYQEKHEVPLVSVHLSPTNFRTEVNTPRLPGVWMRPWQPRLLKRLIWRIIDSVAIDPLVCPTLNSFRDDIGLPPVKRAFHQWIHSPQRVIAMFPDWFAPLQPDWPPQTEQTGFPLFDDEGSGGLPYEVSRSLEAGDRPLVFTAGTGMVYGNRFFEESAGACELLGRNGIFLTRYPEQLPVNLPGRVREVDYVRFSQLLPHTAAIVHHGGIGTCSQAMKAGTPQVIQPMAFDQFDNAARLERLGVARSIPPKQYRSANVASVLKTLIESPKVKEHCQGLAKKFEDTDSLGDTCDLIEAVLLCTTVHKGADAYSPLRVSRQSGSLVDDE